MHEQAPPVDAGVRETHNVFMMPWFLGGPWVPKYGDKDKQSSLKDWQNQIETLIRAQNLNQPQQVDFVLNALEGEARREILLLAAGDRDSPAKIFKALENVYGEEITVVQLRARFFTCKQQAGEEVGAFTLRLRECLARWRKMEEGEDDDEMLQSQLVAGLRPGHLQTELQKLIRRNTTLTFSEVCKEAKAVEQEQHQHAEEASTRRAYVPAPAPKAAKASDEWQQMRETLKAEVLAEMQDQMSTLKEGILGEIRQQFRECQALQPQEDQRGSKNRGRWEARHPPTQRRRNRAPRWDEQGQPICLYCNQPGHMQRECPQRQAPSQGF